MSLKHGLLGLLSYGSMTGYDLDKAFKDSLSFFWQAQTSQIYRELNTMQQKGWLESQHVIQNEKPNKRIYSITAEGKKEFQNWLASESALQADIADSMSVRSGFLMRVFFAGNMEPEQIALMFKAYREKSNGRMDRFGTVSDSIAHYGMVLNSEMHTKYWKIAALYGELFYKAGLEWAEKAIAILEDDSQ